MNNAEEKIKTLLAEWVREQVASAVQPIGDELAAHIADEDSDMRRVIEILTRLEARIDQELVRLSKK